MTNARLALALSLGLSACVATAQPAAPMGPPPPAPMGPPAAPPPAGAVDNGQPRMEAALQALAGARAELAAATPNKGGHRERALQLVDNATNEVQAGITYAQQHPHEVGRPESAAAPEPVSDNVPGGNQEPHMRNAVIQLREARKQLNDASHDKGGHRETAMKVINDAINQTIEGIKFSEHR